MNDRLFSGTPSDAEQGLILAALDALKEKVSVEGRMVEPEATPPARYQPDAALDLAYESGSTRYAVVCKFLVDRKAHIDKARRQLETTGYPSLLIAPYITKELAEHCRATGLQFIDTSGNAYLQAPGLFILVTGEKKRTLPAPSARTQRTHESRRPANGIRLACNARRRSFAIQGACESCRRFAGNSL